MEADVLTLGTLLTQLATVTQSLQDVSVVTSPAASASPADAAPGQPPVDAETAAQRRAQLALLRATVEGVQTVLEDPARYILLQDNVAEVHPNTYQPLQVQTARCRCALVPTARRPNPSLEADPPAPAPIGLPVRRPPPRCARARAQVVNLVVFNDAVLIARPHKVAAPASAKGKTALAAAASKAAAAAQGFVADQCLPIRDVAPVNLRDTDGRDAVSSPSAHVHAPQA